TCRTESPERLLAFPGRLPTAASTPNFWLPVPAYGNRESGVGSFCFVRQAIHTLTAVLPIGEDSRHE
ncbi:MAG TPA: hypothetical protein VFQ06_07275, partial [Nitrospira sp.]|nr:hypothetical protein [Nitrospira sp.]